MKTMPLVEARVSCPVHDSFRVRQVAGLFDVPLAEKAAAYFAVEIPGADEPWDIGLIVGPSGSGKSTVARQAFGEALTTERPWPTDHAVIDGFGDLPMKTITGLLTAVGFSSPPSWIKPYHVLSGGERFRCDLARALAAATGSERPIVAFDEFTSVVDRTVARVGSAAIAKAISRGNGPLPLRGGLVSLRRRPVAGARLGGRHGERRLPAEAASATPRSSCGSFAAGALFGPCLRVITI